MALTILPLVVWYAIYPMEVIEYNLSTTSFCWLCSYPTAKVGNWHNFTISEFATGVWCFLLIAVSAFLAFKVSFFFHSKVICSNHFFSLSPLFQTRNISSKWSETNQIAYVS